MALSDQLGDQREVALSKGTIRYRERGEGPALLFVHGFLVNGDLWRKVVPELTGFRCITPDLPLGSHTSAMKPGADLSPTAVVDLIVELADALELDAPTLVGNDTGGALCQLAVTRSPKRFGGLVLTPCDAFEQFPPAPYNLLRYLPRIPAGTVTFLQPMRTRLGRKLAYGPLMKHGYDDAIVESWVRPALASKQIRRDIDKFITGAHPRLTQEAARLLPSFDRPALIAWPPRNRFFKYSVAERLAETLPNATLVPIEDAWTFLPEDQPGQLARAIEEFALAPVGA